MEPFGDRLAHAVMRCGAPACVGLDPHLEMLPRALTAPLDGLEGAAWREQAAAIVRHFSLGAIEAVAGLVPAVKPQVAFYELLGAAGVAVLEDVVRAAREAGLIVVLDAKRGDIGSTAEAYARATLDDGGPLASDAVTLSPYLGPESLRPFVSRCDRGRGVFVLLRTSNPGAGAWQGGDDQIAGRVAEYLATEGAARRGRYASPIGAVVGATLPEEAGHWRERLPDAWLLVPGYGAQGAGAREILPHVRADGLGALIVSARAVLFPPQGHTDDDFRAGIAARARGFVDELRAVIPASFTTAVSTARGP